MVVDVFDVATANIALSFPSFLSTELQFNETGSPDEFDGCFRLGSQFFAEGSSDSTLGGALIAEGVGLLDGVFRPIVVSRYLLPQIVLRTLTELQGCFDGSTIFTIIPESKRSIRENAATEGSREAFSKRNVINRNFVKRDFTCPPGDLSNFGQPVESGTGIPI